MTVPSGCGDWADLDSRQLGVDEEAERVQQLVPLAVTGAILLWAGATYEARLRNLGNLRKIVSAMR
jgi:hypothetical protein